MIVTLLDLIDAYNKISIQDRSLEGLVEYDSTNMHKIVTQAILPCYRSYEAKLGIEYSQNY